MDPVFFSIGNLTIRWYGFMAALGFENAVYRIVKDLAADTQGANSQLLTHHNQLIITTYNEHVGITG